jgi:hypothetical protein
MIERVLNLNQRTVSSIMTSRHDIEHIDLSAPEEEIRACWRKISIPGWSSPAEMMMKICSAWFTLSTCYSNRCAMNRSTCASCFVSRWCSRDAASVASAGAVPPCQDPFRFRGG